MGLTDFYYVADPTKLDGVGDQVLGAYVPAEGVPVNHCVIADNFAGK